MRWKDLLPKLGCGGLLAIQCACVPAAQSRSAEELRRADQLIDQGTYFLRVGELDRAEASFTLAAELGPKAAAYDGLGCVEFLRGHVQRAERNFVRAYELDNEYAQALSNLALLYESQGLYGEAKKLYRLALRMDPVDFRARNNFAAFLIDRVSDTGRARGELLKAGALADHPLISENLSKVEGP